MVLRRFAGRGVSRVCWALVTAAALLPAACRCQRSEPGTAPSAQGPAASQSAPVGSAQVPSLAAGPPASPSPLAEDALWKEAAGGESIDLARLANREGAAGLLEGVEVGGTVGLTALAALPHADDGELALGRLCEILARGAAAQAEPVLRAVHGIVARPPPQAERLDLDGYRSCAPVLGAARRNSALSPGVRDLAASAHALLAEHGVSGP